MHTIRPRQKDRQKRPWQCHLSFYVSKHEARLQKELTCGSSSDSKGMALLVLDGPSLASPLVGLMHPFFLWSLSPHTTQAISNCAAQGASTGSGRNGEAPCCRRLKRISESPHSAVIAVDTMLYWGSSEVERRQSRLVNDEEGASLVDRGLSSMEDCLGVLFCWIVRSPSWMRASVDGSSLSVVVEREERKSVSGLIMVE